VLVAGATVTTVAAASATATTTTAATEATATAAEATTATATITTTFAAAATWAAFFARTSFVNSKSSVLELEAIQSFNSFGGILIANHFDETEAA
jgi:hypothetical protein